MRKACYNNKIFFVDLIENVYFSVGLVFGAKQKQQENNCCALQTNTCRNNQCLFLNLECRQTSVYSTDKTFAVQVSLNRAKKIRYPLRMAPLVKTHLIFDSFSNVQMIFLKNHLIWHCLKGWCINGTVIVVHAI